jgi:DNA-binding beta-propeller fold protein YncE
MYTHLGRAPYRAFLAALVMLSIATDMRATDNPLQRIAVIPLQGPAGKMDHQAIDRKRGRLFVANTANASLDIVDLKAGKLLKQVPGQKGIQGIAYASDLDRVFVGNGGGGICNVFDGEDYRLLRTIPFGVDADNVRYNPDSHRVYVAQADKNIAILDGASYDTRPAIELTRPLGAMLLDSAHRQLYINTKATGQVVVIDLPTEKVAARFAVTLAGNNSALAIDNEGRRLFIGCRKKPLMVVLDSESGKEVASAPLAGDVDDMYFDSQRKRIYASCGEGFLVVIRQSDPDKYEVEAKLPTANRARTSLFDPDSGRLYLIVPHQPDRPSPEVWVYEARP